MNVERLRALAARVISDRKWVALDFHLADHELTMVLVTPEEVQVITRRVTPFLARLIDRPDQIHHATGSDPARSYVALGRLLLQEIEALVEPDTFLFIAPHGPLHDLPWAALHLPESGRPLAAAAIPVVVPTLSTLALLWQQEDLEEAGEEAREAGLLLAISDFDGRRQRLDAVIAEAERLENVPDLSVVSLREELATWEALLARAGNHGLARYRFWHVASHAFHDQYSGRLSGVALYDRDIWLDDLWRFAPLPPLVVISACSAGKYGLFAGDEPIGLVTTALAAGARQVVASQRPVPDAEAATLTGYFYDAFVQGRGAPEALALAQRAAMAEGMPAAVWGHYLCVGTP
jgi:CHAT domain-containing protein